MCDSGRGRRGEARGPGSRPGEREASPGYRGSAEASRTAGSACLRLRAGRTGKRVDRGEDSRLWPCAPKPRLTPRSVCSSLRQDTGFTRRSLDPPGEGQREHPPRVISPSCGSPGARRAGPGSLPRVSRGRGQGVTGRDSCLEPWGGVCRALLESPAPVKTPEKASHPKSKPS